jgi:hypothetical protein
MSGSKAADLFADVRLYAVDEGGKTQAVLDDFRCPLFVSRDTSAGGWDVRMQFTGSPFEPGTERRVGLAFLSDQGAQAIRNARRFYVWDGRFVGEGIVVAGGQQ